VRWVPRARPPRQPACSIAKGTESGAAADDIIVYFLPFDRRAVHHQGRRLTLAEAPPPSLFLTVSFPKSSARVRNGTRLLTRNDGSLRAGRQVIVNAKGVVALVRGALAGDRALTCKTFHPCLRKGGIVAFGRNNSLGAKSRDVKSHSQRMKKARRPLACRLECGDEMKGVSASAD
jgi:hypothetical protein